MGIDKESGGVITEEGTGDRTKWCGGIGSLGLGNSENDDIRAADLRVHIQSMDTFPISPYDIR
jgi:hypothetical protein